MMDTQRGVEHEILQGTAIIASALFTATRRLGSSVTTEDLRTAVEMGTLSSFLDDLDQYFLPVSEAAAGVARRAAIAAAKTASRQIGRPLAFDSSDGSFLRSVQRNQQRLVQLLVMGQIRSIQVAAAIGGTVDEIVAHVRQAVGQTPMGEAAVRRFDRTLQNTRAGEIDALISPRPVQPTSPLSPKQIELMVNNFRRKLIRFRINTLARTEASGAVHVGINALARQKADGGVLTATQTWNTSRDERVRDGRHATLDQQEMPLGDLFTTGLGNLLRFPADPDAPAADAVGCRCVLTTNFVGRKLLA